MRDWEPISPRFPHFHHGIPHTNILNHWELMARPNPAFQDAKFLYVPKSQIFFPVS